MQFKQFEVASHNPFVLTTPPPPPDCVAFFQSHLKKSSRLKTRVLNQNRPFFALNLSYSRTFAIAGLISALSSCRGRNNKTRNPASHRPQLHLLHQNVNGTPATHSASQKFWVIKCSRQAFVRVRAAFPDTKHEPPHVPTRWPQQARLPTVTCIPWENPPGLA